MNATLESLLPYTNYFVAICAYTEGGEGPFVNVTILTDEAGILYTAFV